MGCSGRGGFLKNVLPVGLSDRLDVGNESTKGDLKGLGLRDLRMGLPSSAWGRCWWEVWWQAQVLGIDRTELGHLLDILVEMRIRQVDIGVWNL